MIENENPLEEIEAKRGERRRNISRLIGVTVFNTGLMVIAGAGARAHQGMNAILEVAREGNMLPVVEAGHDLGDAAVSGGRVAVEMGESSESKWFRRFQYGSFALASGTGAAAAGVSLFELIDSFGGFTIHNPSDNLEDVGLATTFLAGNGGAMYLAKGLEGDSPNIHNAKHHTDVDFRASAVIVAGLLAGTAVSDVAEIAAIGAGGFTAIEMRPTAKNIDHHFEEELHEH